MQRNYCCCMKIYAYDSKIPSVRLWGELLEPMFVYVYND